MPNANPSLCCVPPRLPPPVDAPAPLSPEARPLNVKDALSYLEMVKIKFQDKPHIYNHFLDIMKEFQSQAIDTPGVIEQVSSLFIGHTALIQGFNTFILPTGYRIDCTTEHDHTLIIVTTPSGTTTQTMYTDAIHPDSVLVQKGAPPMVEFNQAVNYVNKIKQRFASDPDTYKQFLEILQGHSKERSVVEVYQQVSVLLDNQRDLLEEFKLFLPNGLTTTTTPSETTTTIIEPISHVDGTGQYTNESVDILQSHTPQYVASIMYERLIKHGCPDLISLIDPLGFSSSAVAEGGFGDIWKGRFHDSRKLAIKVLRFACLIGDNTEKELKRFAREIYNWSKLNHENVNKLMGVIMFQERLGMVSEWMEYGNLRQYLNHNTGADRHQLCIQTARGMTYLHGVNMIHGDLKARNILVSSAGILKITDFDYSIFPECSLAFSATSRMGGGTLRWMAPELVLEKKSPQRNLKTDIYALGMTFLETITNDEPYFECKHDVQVLLALLHKERPERSEEHFPDTESGNRIWDLLLQCCDFNPLSRPTSDEILELLLMA